MKPLIRYLTLFCALILIVSTGCIEFDFDWVTFANPTVAPERAKMQRKLFGSFVCKAPPEPKEKGVENFDFGDSDTNSSFIHIGRAGKGFPRGFLRIVSVDNDSRGEISVDDSSLPCFASKIGDLYILNVPIAKQLIDGEKASIEKVSPRITKWEPGNYEGYNLMLLKPTKTGFTMHSINEEFLQSEITAGRLDGKFMTEAQNVEYDKNHKAAKREGTVAEDKWIPFVIEASTEELRAFIEKNSKDFVVGEPEAILTRVK